MFIIARWKKSKKEESEACDTPVVYVCSLTPPQNSSGSNLSLLPLACPVTRQHASDRLQDAEAYFMELVRFLE